MRAAMIPAPANALVVAALVVAAVPATAWAQPADLPIPAATTDRYPPGVQVREVAGGKVYADRRGLVLYGMDMRTVLRWSPDASQYCRGACEAEWEPLLAPPGTPVNIRFPGAPGRSRPDGAPDPEPATLIDNRKAPDWSVIRGPSGPQWVYKGWHMVYTRRGSAPGSIEFDGADDFIWNTLKFVPPVPQVVAPPGIAPAFVEGRYRLVDTAGRILFTGACTNPCVWTPLAAPAASRGIGKWQVDLSGETPQWRLGKQRVFVSPGADVADLPTGARPLEP